jgi:pimeloyl-ACP methyl ester carboxylesterase
MNGLMKDETGEPADTVASAAVERRASYRVRGAIPRRNRRRIMLFVFVAIVVLFWRPAGQHARATSLLMAFSDPNAKVEASEEVFDIDVPASPNGPARKVKARLFTPPGKKATDVPAMVLVHGVQYRGIEEPRFQRFARALVSAGIAVLTPQIDELADYRVAPPSIDTAGAAVDALRARSGHTKVGLMGTSFGGGVSLLAAGDPRFADHVSFVVAVGAHDDLARVSRFFATNEIADVNGKTIALHAHEYGGTILVYTHIENFFPEDDQPAAREALKNWIWEKRDEARESAKKLSPESKDKVEKLFAADLSSVRAELITQIDRLAPQMNEVSPHGHLGGMKAHVYLLHGAGDTVIPASETDWLAHDVPPQSLCGVLKSAALVHVDLENPTIYQRWQLVHFMGQVIAEADGS